AAAGRALDERGGTTREAAAAGVAAVARGVDAAAAIGGVRRDERTRWNAGIGARADADADTRAHARTLLHVLLELHRRRRAADLGEFVSHREQADARRLLARVVELFARRFVGLGPPGFRHRRLGRLRLAGFRNLLRVLLVFGAGWLLRLHHRWRHD